MEVAEKLRQIDDILTLYISCLIPDHVAMAMIEATINRDDKIPIASNC